MDIGKNIGKQRSPLAINLTAQKDIRDSVNVLRKPHFDERFFNTSFDASGWYVTLNDEVITSHLPIHEPAFFMSPDESKNGTITERYIKIKDGYWTRSNGLDDGLKENLHIDPDTLSSPFEKGYLWENDATKDYIRMQIDADDEIWVWLELRDNNGKLDGLNPTKMVIQSGADRPEFDTFPEKSTDGIGHHALQVLGRVKNLGGTLLIYQEYTGFINDRGVYADGVSYNDGDEDPTGPYIYGLNYISEDVRAKNALQDYEAYDSLITEDDVMEFVGDICGVFYELKELNGDDEDKQIKKVYYRIDNHVTYPDRNDSGRSLECKTVGGEGATKFLQIYEFFENTPVVMDDATKFDSGNNEYLLMSRFMDAAANDVIPTVKYLDMEPILEHPTIEMHGSDTIAIGEAKFTGLTLSHTDGSDYFAYDTSDITIDSDHEGYYMCNAKCTLTAQYSYNEQEQPDAIPFHSTPTLKIRTDATVLDTAAATVFGTVTSDSVQSPDHYYLTITLNCHAIIVFDTTDESGNSNTTTGNINLMINNNTLADMSVGNVNLTLHKIKPIPGAG